MLPMFLVPNTPLIRSYSLPEMRVDVWSWPDAYRSFFPEEETDTADAAPRFDYESLLYRQSAMVEAALGRVAPASGDGAQFYFVGAAPSSYHAVFRREVESARAVFNERFGTQDRSISLISDTETSEQAPLASMTNLTRILEGFGQKMNKDRDVLVLFLTSHGSKEELQVHFPGAHFNPMTSMGIAKALDASGIKNRVIIVSACHSGSMIPDLEGPNTLILTAAHADKTSFGCSNDRDWTYFGDALFNHALRETRSLPEAFERAKVLIAAWESEQGYTPSEPQMSAGEAILGTLNAMPHGPVDSRAAVMD